MRDLLGYTETDDVSLSKRMGHLNTSAMEHLDGGVQDSQLLEGQKQDACKAHQRVALRSLPRLSVNAINTEDLESIFSRPRTSRKKKPWMYQMYRRQDVRFRFYHTRFHPQHDGFMIGVCLGTLFDYIVYRIQPKDQNDIHLQTGRECRYRVSYKGKLHALSGIPDYVLNYNAQEKTAIKLVVVTAKQPDFACCSDNTLYTCCGRDQLAAYMSMIHTHRKSRGEKDCVVYGLRTDAIGFWFYRIANNSKITAKVLKAKLRPRYIDYDRITGLMASIFEEAYMLSPGHENTLADDYKRAGGSSRSHSSDTQSSN